MLVPAFDKTAPYVWAAYGLSALVLVAVAVWILIRARKARRRLDRLERDDVPGDDT